MRKQLENVSHSDGTTEPTSSVASKPNVVGISNVAGASSVEAWIGMFQYSSIS